MEDLRQIVDPEWSIVFRAHPGELAVVEDRYPWIAANANVEIDRNPDVYDSLAGCRAVVGVASTVLFEAAAFGCEVIARENEFSASIIGAAFGPRVLTVEQAAERIRALDADGIVAGTPDPDLWTPEPAAAYRRWLDERLAQIGG